MEIKATVLCENCVFSNMGAIAEHGWAVYIETEYGHYLLDTGQGKGIINNARIFHKDLSKLQGIIISHHHWDHTGGLLSVLELTGKTKVYSHPDLFRKSYVKEKTYDRYIGIPFCREALESRGADFIFNTDFSEITSNMSISGEIPRKTSFEKGDGRLLIKTDTGYEQDQMVDDQTLIINTTKGLVLILGCSHSGIVNIIRYAMEKTGQKHIHTIIGGTHLGPANKETRKETIQALKEFDIERIGVSHCTGLEASMQFSYEFKERFFFCNVGKVVEI